jgi:type VI secretion system protein ImpE
MNLPAVTVASQSFRDWCHAKPLSDAVTRAEASVRTKPQDPQARWLLFELLCVLGQWDRAVKQLQVWAGLSKEFDGTAHVMRGLIKAERQRMDVLAGKAEPATVAAAQAGAPAPVVDDEALDVHAPVWMGDLAEALRRGAAGQGGAAEASDAAREAALSQVPDTPGSSNLQPSFNWIADSDSRLGPVCEVILIGAYRWLAFDDIRTLTKAAPERLLDLVWSQVDIVLRDGTPLKGYMPMRYPVHEGDRDALLMARETVWHEIGRTGVYGRGQKMWMTDAGDMALLDLRACRFGPAASATG